jgi:transposase
MDKELRHVAKVQLMAEMQAGQAFQTAAAKSGLQMSQSNAYRLWGAFRQHGEAALSDGRHGHPSKLRGAARVFLEERCRQAPRTPSSVIQVELRERFALSVSVSQINRVRAVLRISNHRKSQQQGKKDRREELFPSTRVAGRCWESLVTGSGSPNGTAAPSRVSALAQSAHR